MLFKTLKNHFSYVLSALDPVTVGWMLESNKATFIWEEPHLFKRTPSKLQHAKAVDRCPSIRDFESRLIEITSPIDIQLGITKDAKGHWALVNIMEQRSSITSSYISKMF